MKAKLHVNYKTESVVTHDYRYSRSNTNYQTPKKQVKVESNFYSDIQRMVDNAWSFGLP